MRNQGSAKRLEGMCLTLMVFVSEPGNPWPAGEKNRIRDMIFEAEDWMSERAGEYERKLEFDNLSFGWKEDVVLPRIPEGADEAYDTWVADIARKMGYDSPGHLFQAVAGQGSFDNIHMLILPNREGRGYALPFGDNVKSEYFFEAGVVYRSDNGEEINAATVAHEILHLYGAFDLYAYTETERERETRAKAKFPEDIMLTILPDIQFNKAGELTAYSVGWHDEFKDWYTEFVPPKYQRWYKMK